MKATQRLLAEVSRPRYLAVGRPTGLTGLLTHRSPRSTLIYVYSSTLEKLKRLPEWSVYRQATEKLTRHRLALVEQTVPQGLQDWEQRLQSQLKGREGLLDQQHFVRREELNGRHFVVARPRNIQHGANSTVAEQEADEAGEEEEAEHLTEDIEGQGREEEERQLDDLIEATQKAIDISGGAEQSLKLELEPQLTVDQ